MRQACRYAVLFLAAACGCSKHADSGVHSPRIGPSAEVPVGGPNPLRAGESRPANPTCIAPERPRAEVELVRVFPNLDLEAPVALVQAPRQQGDVSGRWFLIEQRGRVQSFLANETGEASDVQITDMTARVASAENLDERGLLGIALHPRFPTDPRVFLVFNTNAGGLANQLSSFVATSSGRLDLASEVPLHRVSQPYTNHNGGGIVFGPDGYLYYGLGDGGDGGDPHGHGQDTDTLLGSLLRIDVDGTSGAQPYRIPSDNPFVAGGGAPEIYAYGLRNPWRFSFDRETGQLWVGDVGQNEWEEIDIVERGGNYGWNVWEGRTCFSSDSCSASGFEAPVHVYENPGGSAARSVTGGYVYRGSELPDLVGNYVFGDYATGEMWQLVREGEGYSAKDLLESGINISSFGEDQTGELYVLDYGGGRVLRLSRGPGPSATLPTLLSLTGCVNPDNVSQMTSGAVPYEVALPFWSDGAEKERYLALPDGTALSARDDGDLELPKGGVSIKHFRHDGRRIETRFYVRHTDGEYSGYSYAWRGDGSDAELVPESTSRRWGNLNWIYPGRNECNQCHTSVAGRSLGLELRQLDITNSEASVNQLDALRRLGMLADVPSPAEVFAATSAPLTQRARAYLHVNCSNCHQPGGLGRGGLDLRFDTALPNTGLCGIATLGALDTAQGDLIAPGDRTQSVLYQRINARDENGMPPLASRLVDAAGVALIGDFIDSLASCP